MINLCKQEKPLGYGHRDFYVLKGICTKLPRNLELRLVYGFLRMTPRKLETTEPFGCKMGGSLCTGRRIPHNG